MPGAIFRNYTAHQYLPLDKRHDQHIHRTGGTLVRLDVQRSDDDIVSLGQVDMALTGLGMSRCISVSVL